MTVAEIIAWAKRKKNTSETDANLIIDLDGIQDEIYTELNSYKLGFGYFEVHSLLTVSGVLNYTLPTDCKPESIISIQVSQAVTIDANTVWDDFKYAGLNDNINSGCWWGKGSVTGKIALTKDGITINTDSLTVRIFYLPTPAQITLTTQTPDLEKQYHNLYKYALVQEICAQGDNPDTNLADYYQKEYDEFMLKVKDDIDTRYNKLPNRELRLEGKW